MSELISTTRNEIAVTRGLGFEQLASRFLATRKSARTKVTYGRALALYHDQAQSQGLEPLSGDAIISFSQKQNEAIDAGDISADTARSRLRSVASFFSWLHKFDVSPLKPRLVTSELMTIPPARKLSPRDILTEAEACDLIDSAGAGRDCILIRILLDGGLRISEALALTGQDVYRDGQNYYLHIEKGKGSREREVTVAAELFDGISLFVAESGQSLRSRERIFDMHPSTAWRIVKRLADEAGIEKNITPHSLRHTHGNTLAREGWAIELIAARLGHASIDTTKIYTRPAELALARTPTMPWARR